MSARKALHQIETALASDVWGGESCELRLAFLDRFLCPDEPMSGSTSTSSSGIHMPANGSAAASTGGNASSSSSNHGNAGPMQSSGVFMTLEVLRVIYSSLVSLPGHLRISFAHFICSVFSGSISHKVNSNSNDAPKFYRVGFREFIFSLPLKLQSYIQRVIWINFQLLMHYVRSPTFPVNCQA